MNLFSWLRTSNAVADTAQMARQRLRTAPNRPAPRFRPRLEALEDRMVPCTLGVNSAVDETIPGDGLLSLREAISAANSGDKIVFDSGLSGLTISLTGG